jgi:replicative DNA helicase
MGSNQLMQRLLSNYSEVSSSKLSTGSWNETEEFIIFSAAKEIGHLDIKIDDASNPTILDIQSKLQKIHNDKKIKLIIIDYLQLIAGNNKIGANRQQEVSQISRTLKSIARTYDCPLIAIAQLSRKIEERKGEDKKPILSDLRESGSIEQDADLVTFLNHDTDNVNDDIIPVNFYIAKHRNGAVGNVKLFFKKDIGKFITIKKGPN